MAWNDEGLILARAFKAESDALQKIKELETRNAEWAAESIRLLGIIKEQQKELTFYREQDRLLSMGNFWSKQ